MRKISYKTKPRSGEYPVRAFIMILLCTAIHLCLPDMALPAPPETACIKTFATSKGKDIILNKINRPMTEDQRRRALDSEYRDYVLNNKTGRDNYNPKDPPSWSQNCAGHVMGKLFKNEIKAKYNYDVTRFFNDIVTPYGGYITRIGDNGEGTELIEKGDILNYPPAPNVGGSSHVAYVEDVKSTTDAQGNLRKILIIHSKCDEESIYEIDVNPEEWQKDPLASRRSGRFSLPIVYRVSASAVNPQEKYPGSDCDLEEFEVEVLDKTSNSEIDDGASVKVSEGGPPDTQSTKGGKVKLKRYWGKDVKVSVSKDTYLPKENILLSKDRTRLTVWLEKKPDIGSIKNTFDGEIAKLIQLRDAADAARKNVKSHIGGSHAKDIKDAQELLRLLNEGKKEIEQANNDCLQAPSYISQAISDAVEAELARDTAVSQANAISSQVGSCKSKADVDKLEKAWETASKEGGTALAFGARAEGTVEKVKKIVARANAAFASLSTCKQPPDPSDTSIKCLMERLALIRLPEKAYYDRLDSLINDANKKKADFDKAKDDLLWKIHIERGKMGEKNEATFDALTKRVKAVQLQNGEDMGALRTNLLKELKAVYDAKKNAKDVYDALIKLPLCSGVNVVTLLTVLQDAKKAQSDIVQYVTSDLLEKINACRAKLNLPPSGQQTAGGQVTLRKPLNAFGIHPPQVTLALGQSQELRAYLVYTDGTSDDISQQCTWSRPRVFKANMIGTWLVEAKANLDTARVVYAVIKVTGAFSISGPDRGSVGTRATFSVTGLGAPQGSREYEFRWYGDGKQLTSTTDSQVISLQTPGQHVITAKVWNWSGAKWEGVGEKFKTIVIEASPSTPQTQGGQVGKFRKRRDCKYSDNMDARCSQYGGDGVAQYDENMRRGCGYEKQNSGRWHSNVGNHVSWCRNIAGPDGPGRECSDRENQLDTCAERKPRGK